jgi:hypothetical protein
MDGHECVISGLMRRDKCGRPCMSKGFFRAKKYCGVRTTSRRIDRIVVVALRSWFWAAGYSGAKIHAPADALGNPYALTPGEDDDLACAAMSARELSVGSLGTAWSYVTDCQQLIAQECADWKCAFDSHECLKR